MDTIKLLKAKESEIWYSTDLNSHKFLKTHLDYLKYETCITHIQILHILYGDYLDQYLAAIYMVMAIQMKLVSGFNRGGKE
jgi:hypothetical protein